jgi:stage V sporulation protein K
MFRNNSSSAFIQDIQKTVNSIIPPLTQTLWMLQNRGQFIPNPNAFAIIGQYFQVLGYHFAFLDDNVSMEEITFTEDVLMALGKNDFIMLDNNQLLSYAKQIIEFNPHAFQILHSPPAIMFLNMYDSQYGSDFVMQTKTMYFKFANAITKIDRTVSPKELNSLSSLKGLLFNDSTLSEVQLTAASDKIISIPEISPTLDQIPPTLDQSQNKNINKETIQDDEKKDEQKQDFVRLPEIKDEAVSLEESLTKLNSLVGLENVKKDVLKVINFLKIQKLRQENGLEVYSPSRHMVFSGNPGTGKTTVARLLAQIYRSLGVVSKGHLVETDRAGLVAGYLGQTAIQVAEIVKSAIGGVLFIDEAYSLTANEDNWYGAEVIDTLVKLMEDNRENLIVIVAGYTELMKDFIDSNPGLRSRFNNYLNFDDYTPEQLLKIFKRFCEDSSFLIEPTAGQELLSLFTTLFEQKDQSFGNARLARNLYEITISNQADRIVKLSNVNAEILSTIVLDDIPTLAEIQSSNKN